MSNTTTSTSSGEVGFTGLLTLVFIVLKLTGYIDWSWWWVTSPLWIPFLVIIGIFGLCAVGIVLYYVLEAVYKHYTKKATNKKS